MFLHGHHFYDYLKCKHRVYLDFYGDPREKDKETDFVEMLWYRGIRHEKKIVSKIAKRKKVAEVTSKNLKKCYQQTIDLMKQGIDFIYQGVLLDKNQVGRPDLLEKSKGESNFGSYFYSPIDIKSGKGIYHKKSGNTVKKEYALQVMHYIQLLEKVQGVRPAQGKIINIDGQVLYFSYQDFLEEYFRVKNDLQAIIEKSKSYEPVIGGHCNLCHWRSHCLEWAQKNKDLSLIFGLGEKKYLLRQNNINSFKDLANLDISHFLLQAKNLRGIGLKSLRIWQKRAQNILAEREEIYRPIEFPSARYEIFFDIEDDPTQDIVYLYGIIERDTKTKRNKSFYFLADKPEEEATTLTNFLDYIDKLDDFVIYHYHHHERITLDHLIRKYNLPRRLYLKFCNHTHDLYQDIIKYTNWPTHSYNLKNIAGYLNFRWSVEDPSGANSIAWYNKYLENPIKNRKFIDKVIQYNHDDCLAIIKIKDYLANYENFKSNNQKH